MQSNEGAGAATAIEDGSAAATTGVDALSSTSRFLTLLVAGLFTVMGLIFFIAPDWVSQNFLWKVPPFAMRTMGGWYLGAGLAALEAVRVWRWAVVYPLIFFLWAFSLLEAGVLLVHANLLRPDAAFGWPYLAVITIAAISALYGVYDCVRLRPRATSAGKEIGQILRIELIVFVIAVFLIAIFPILGYGKNKQVFPETLTVFTLHAFGVFYMSLAIAALSLVRAKSILPALFYARTGLILIVTITLAAVIDFGKFNFSEHPLSIAYWVAYIGVGIGASLAVISDWSYSMSTERTA